MQLKDGRGAGEKSVGVAIPWAPMEFPDENGGYYDSTPGFTPIRRHASSYHPPVRYNPYHPQPTSNQAMECSSPAASPTSGLMEDIFKSQNELKEMVKNLAARVEKLEEKSSHQSSPSLSSKKLPTELSKMVAQVYQTLSEGKEEFDLSKGVNVLLRSADQQNVKIKEKMKEEVLLGCNKYPPATVQRAVQRYYESRKRCHREGVTMSAESRNAQNKKRKVRARKVRLFERRGKVALQQENEKLKDLTVECMSDESSDSAGENMVVHKPVWRSRVLNNFLSELDKRAETPEQKKPNPRKIRIQGAAKESIPPLKLKKWMLSTSWLAAHPEYLTPQDGPNVSG